MIHLSPNYQALFALAWLHAVVQERRNFIPQGWTKFYEFSLGDMRAGADLIDRLFASKSCYCVSPNYKMGYNSRRMNHAFFVNPG